MPRYSEKEAREAVAASFCYSGALRRLGLRPAGGNHRLFRKYVDEVWRIPTEHFDPRHAGVTGLKRTRPIPLEQVLVDGSTYSRSKLKSRLYETGLKARQCEICGQDERWQGMPMSLILDHINGTPDDNRIENLRIVCPNCAATFDTHCGRKNRISTSPRICALCGDRFAPRYQKQRYCSQRCGTRHDNRKRQSKPLKRKVPRPSYEQLKADLRSMSYVATGRKYGVSDNAIRKWIRRYEYERELEAWKAQRAGPADQAA
jgi:hypothetical protein